MTERELLQQQRLRMQERLLERQLAKAAEMRAQGKHYDQRRFSFKPTQLVRKVNENT